MALEPSTGFCLVSVLPYPGGVGGWVWQNFRVGGCPTPPPGCGGTLWGPLGLSSQCHFFLSSVAGWGHLAVCGYAKILGGWVPELTPPPQVAKQNLGPARLSFEPIDRQAMMPPSALMTERVVQYMLQLGFLTLDWASCVLMLLRAPKHQH